MSGLRKVRLYERGKERGEEYWREDVLIYRDMSQNWKLKIRTGRVRPKQKTKKRGTETYQRVKLVLDFDRCENISEGMEDSSKIMKGLIERMTQKCT